MPTADTFRDADGLWADYRIEDVCTPEALARNRRLVIEFYNKRRREMLAARPNAAHLAIAGLEADFDVEVITQNVDDLHERAGSTRVTHLHGELRKLRSSRDPALIVPIEGRGGSPVRPCGADCGGGRRVDRRRNVAGGLSGGFAGALRPSRGADLSGRPWRSRRADDP